MLLIKTVMNKILEKYYLLSNDLILKKVWSGPDSSNFLFQSRFNSVEMGVIGVDGFCTGVTGTDGVSCFRRVGMEK